MASTPEREQLRLLLVEDNPGDARLLTERLRGSRLGVGIRRVESLATAIGALSEDVFDVCLLDLDLPDSRGAETVERMRAAAADLPIVVLTGLSDLEAASEAYRAGAVDYLVKDEVSPHAVERTLRFVSERLRTWETLAVAEEKWATVFELLPVGVVVSDAESGRLIEMNRAFCEIFGRTREEMIGETSLGLTQWEDPDRRRALVDRVREEGVFRDEEAWFRSADGSRGLMLLSCRQLEVAGDDRLLWTVQDVTELRLDEEWRALLAHTVEAAANGVMITDADGEIVWVNSEFTRMTGYSREEATGRTPALLRSGVHDDSYYEELWETIARGETWRGEFTNRRKDGELYVERQSIVPVCHRSDEVTHYVAIMEDVTEERRRQEELRKSEERFRALFEESRDPILFSTVDGRVVDANPAFHELSGYSADDLSEIDLEEFYVNSEDRHLLLNRLLLYGSVANFETRVLLKSGDHAQVQLTASLYEGEEGTRIQTIIRDVTERRQMEEDLRYRAFHDPLTGLANRSLLHERLSLDLARARRTDALLGLAMIDLSRFKTINESLGHGAGDRLLEEVGRRLVGELGPEDTAARLGGDEFVVVLSEAVGREAVGAAVERLVRELRRPYEVAGDEIEVDFNLGVVLHGSRRREGAVDAADPEALLRFADIALVVAKEKSGSSLHWYEPERDRGAEDVLGREQDLRRGLEEREFEVFFQPVWDLRTGEAWGCEALARWRHPTRGLLSPDEFVPLAEETDLIHELGHQLCRLAFAEAVRWDGRLEGDAPYLLLNVSGRQFESERFVDDIATCAKEAGLPPEMVYVEVTESAVVRATGRADALRELGFGVLIDDFGTGYASFHYLRDLAVDGLKVDKSFVHGVLGGRNERAIAATLLSLGNRLGVLTIAEGVETRAQRDEVEAIGCRLAQGFFLGRPMPAVDLRELLSL